MFPTAVSLIFGIVCGYNLFPEITVLVIAIAVLCGILLYISLYFTGNRSAAILSVLAFPVGLYLGHSSLPAKLPDGIADKHVMLSGRVDNARINKDSQRLVMHVTSFRLKSDSAFTDTDFRIVVSMSDNTEKIINGADIEVTGILKDCNRPLDVPYQTDFDKFLFVDGAIGRINIFSRRDIRIDNAAAPRIETFLYDCRARWLEAIAEAGFDENTTEFLTAVIGGEKSVISDDMEQQFRDTGMAHILAISGMHVGIILGILAALMFPLKLSRRARPVYFILLGAAILFFALVSGASPSAMRAAIMGCVMMGSSILECRRDAMQSLSTAVIILLCIKPMWLYSPGFQLSVCAVLALIAFMPILNLFSKRNRVLHLVWNIIFIPIVAVAGTLIPTIYYFHSFAFNFWLANLCGAILVPPIVTLGFLGSLLSLIGLSLPPVAIATEAFYNLFTGMVDFCSNMFPSSRIDIVIGDIALLGLGFAILGVIWLIHNYSHIRCAAIILVLSVGFIIIPDEAESRPDTELYVPRHQGSTDVLIIHEGTNLLWTSSASDIDREHTVKNIQKLYSDFYRHRKTSAEPGILKDGDKLREISLSGNILTIKGRKILRLDSKDDICDSVHFDLAIISEHFRDNMSDLKGRMLVDTVVLSNAINYMRKQKFVRQLDTLSIPYKNLDDKGIVWQFH